MDTNEHEWGQGEKWTTNAARNWMSGATNEHEWGEMNTKQHEPIRMDTNELEWGQAEGRTLLLKDEVYRIVGCAMEVLNELGHGLREKTYERALAVEFRLKVIPFDQQRVFPVNYKGELVDEYIPDLIAFGQIVVDVKTIETIGDFERGQMINYLRITSLRVGIVLNFKHPKLQWERLVL